MHSAALRRAWKIAFAVVFNVHAAERQTKRIVGTDLLLHGVGDTTVVIAVVASGKNARSNKLIGPTQQVNYA